MSRLGLPRPEPDRLDSQPCEERQTLSLERSESSKIEAVVPAPRPVVTLPTRGVRLAGVDLDQAFTLIERECARLVPAFDAVLAQDGSRTCAVVCALWRFTSASIEQIAEVSRNALEHVERVVLESRMRSRVDEAWARMLWRLEWALRWRLAAGPWRS
jgi:hypothetical protein